MTIQVERESELRARWPLLASIDDPSSLKMLEPADLHVLAGEIRDFLVAKVCATGGHLGVNLGVVELSIALHRVFSSPTDVILFDTGHQAYVHKILTGRAAGFDGLRREGGLSGYPSRAESPHDWIENSHASTALAYADGIAKGLHLKGQAGRQVIAVIGDGALTGGLALEGLNNLSGAGRPVIVVLNDNGRSYDPTIGGLAAHLAALRSRNRCDGKALPDSTPINGKTVFEQLGFAYIGPIDGHDVAEAEAALRHAAAQRRPAIVHAVTAKGTGYAPAEADQADHMHGIGMLDPATGRSPSPGEPSWTGVFAEEITKLGGERQDIVCITAAMRLPVGLGRFAAAYPDRVFDTGIAEQHAVCSAAGLAMSGLHPIICIYATFLNRAVDQVLMDVALHRLGATFVLDRAGITGPDGASHHGMWDTTFVAAIPDLMVGAPRDPARLRELLREAADVSDRPTVLRYPKASAGPVIPSLSRMSGLDVLHRSARLPLDVLVVSAGVMAEPALQAARTLERQGIGVTVVDPRWILPVNPCLAHLAARHRLTLTAEDSSRAGGFGSAVVTACADAGVTTPIRTLGLPRAFIHAGDRGRLLRACGLSAEALADTARTELTSRKP